MERGAAAEASTAHMDSSTSASDMPAAAMTAHPLREGWGCKGQRKRQRARCQNTKFRHRASPVNDIEQNLRAWRSFRDFRVISIL
jgi:hypothetical protein